MSVLLLIFLFLTLQVAAYYSEQQATELLKMQKLKLVFTLPKLLFLSQGKNWYIPWYKHMLHLWSLHSHHFKCHP